MAGRVCFKSEDVKTSEKNGPESATRVFDLIGFPTADDAETALLAHAEAARIHPTRPTLKRTEWDVTDLVDPPGDWIATVRYDRRQPDFLGDETYTGNVSIQTVRQHFVQGAGGRWVSDFLADPDKHPFLSYGQLGLKWEDGRWKTEGADIEFPVVSFTIRRTFPKANSQIAVAVALSNYVGRPNSTDWRGFGPQTVKMTGAAISNEDENEDVVEYTFDASPSVGPIEIPTPLSQNGRIVIPQKLGWQMVQIASKPIKVDGPNSSYVIDAPVAATLLEPGPLADYNAILP